MRARSGWLPGDLISTRRALAGALTDGLGLDDLAAVPSVDVGALPALPRRPLGGKVPNGEIWSRELLLLLVTR